MDNESLKPNEAARFVGLSEATLAKARCLGGGPPYVKMGRAVRYLPADLIAWRDSHHVRHTSEASVLPQFSDT